MAILGTAAHAASFDTGGDLRIRWDNTIRLSTIYELHNALFGAAGYCASPKSATATADPFDRHDCGYGTGFNSGRVDWLSELDLNYRNVGLHVSEAAWYDAADNSDRAGHATDTSELGGRNIELFEAFVHGTGDLGNDRPLSLRLGRHTLAWGESLYFAGNGIAAGQAPVDTYMERAIANYQTKDALLPVAQVSASWQALADLAVEFYYQFEWRRSRVDPQHAYASTNDVLGAEGNRLIAVTIPGRGLVYYNRLADQVPDSTGQYGLAMKWRRWDLDWGVYSLRFDAKTPNIYYYPGAGPAGPLLQSFGAYRLEYATGIELYGLSVSGSLGDSNFGAEISGRRNMPLVNGGVFVRPGLLADNRNNPLYPVGDTLHAQFSWIAVIPPLPGLPGGVSWTGEIAADSLLDTTANPNQRVPGRTRSAAALRTVFEPRFFQIVPRVDVTLPIGVGYNFMGLSQVDPAINRGTGDVGLGVTATVDQVWKGAIEVTHYFGRSKVAPVLSNAAAPGQSLSDWDFIGITVQRTF